MVKRALHLPLLIFLLPANVHESGSTASSEARRSFPTPSHKLQALENYKETLQSRGQQLTDQGVLIEGMTEGEILAEHNPDVAFNPASVMKLATSLVAIRKLGPDYRYRTDFLADGYLDSRARRLEGDLVVYGGADPMFALPDAQEVATELGRLGVSRVTGALRVAGSFYYFATGYRSNLSRETSAAKLRAVFQRAGIKIEGPTAFGERTGTLLLSHYSDQLVRILLYQNAHSSNAIAEVVGESVGGPEAMQRYLTSDLDLAESDIYVGRSSGLEFNRITPRASLKVLRSLLGALWEHALKLEEVMPVAGVDSGTLRGRLERADVRGSVIAKTGTLVSIDNGVSTLVGVAYTRDAGPLLFAVFNSGGSVYGHRRLQDEFLEELIAGKGGAVKSSRVEDALEDQTRRSILQVFYSTAAKSSSSAAD